MAIHARDPVIMPKNIIICSDGTGNTGIKDRGTNVFKMFEAIDLNGHRTDPRLTPQVALYDDGVGTQTFLPLKLLGGAFGWGLKRNVLKLYTGLVRIYDPGDRIFLFGFSRGAFTVRTLAGLIARCGILDWNRLDGTDAMRAAVTGAYRSYREAYRTWLWRVLHGKSVADIEALAEEASSALKAEYKPEEAEIHFIGVWDTVDSVGGPFHISDLINTFVHRFKFPDRKLSPKVHHAVQALSIDDARASFEPRLWEHGPNVEQVWFAGVHCNVGGGYPKQGMSLVALDWMMHKAIDRGLRILANDRTFYAEHCSVDDKLYDSRAGLGVFYRWKPRDMRKLTERQNGGLPPAIHMSVLERVAHGTDGYAPGNLAPVMHITYTRTGDTDHDEAASARSGALAAVLQKAFRDAKPELDRRVRPALLLGRASYYLFITSCAGVLAAGRQILNYPQLLWIFLAGLTASAALGSHVDRRRSLAFSRFWHTIRHDLRDALKDATRRMQQKVSTSSISEEVGTSQGTATLSKRSGF